MSTLYVRRRTIGNGESRYDVRYRTGGRYAKVEHAGTYKTETEAEIRRQRVARLLAAGIKPGPEPVYSSDYIWIYFIQEEGGPIKIGRTSKDVSRRLGQLQAATHRKLHLLGGFNGTGEEEKRIHERFAHLRIRGEWFEDDPEIHELIEAVCA